MMSKTRNVLLVTSAAPSQSPFSTAEKRPPIGIGFLISVLRNAGHNVFFIDNYLKPNNFLETDYLQRNDIHFVGIYANTICYRDTLRMIYRINHLRRSGHWDGKIIIGGPHTSVALDTIPSFVDHVVQGEGERVILDIVDDKITERVVRYPCIRKLDELPMPAWDYFVHLPYNWGVDWFNEKPVFTMNTSRGCPFQCAFCSVGSIWGKQYTYFSAERIVEEIEFLIERYGAKGIYFREDNFTLNRKRLIHFCKLLIEKGIKIYWACESRVNTLDAELVELMYHAGVRAFYFGVESGSQRLLDFMRKNITVKQIRDAFALCHKFGIKAAASIIVGVPTETEKDLQETEVLIREIKPAMIWHNVFVGIPNSKLYRYAIKEKLYEFIDDRGLVYLNGHNDRVKRFYGNSWDALIPFYKENPKISVVMSVYNGSAHLENAIKSILKQTYPNFEFIIIDDASTDATPEVLKKFDDSRIQIIRNNENTGLTRSLNRGIQPAKGQYIARMDADDISHPLRFEKQVAYLDANKDCLAVGTWAGVIREDGRQCDLWKTSANAAGLIDSNAIVHGSAMIRKSVFQKLGGYDEQFDYAQDYDLWLRMSEVGTLSNLQEELYYWRYHKGSVSIARKSEQNRFAELARAVAIERRKQVGQRHDALVSVIVPTYNRPEMLVKALHSIFEQTYKNYEIIVVNDCGVDVEQEISSMRSCCSITYVKQNKNRGLAAARNTGLKLARGKYIAYLDDDDLYYPNHLETLVEALYFSDYRVAYTDAHRAHQEKKNGVYVVTRRDVPYSFDFDYNKILETNFIPVLCFMHERSCLEEIGLFDESLKRLEDWDMWIRMSRKFKFEHIKKLTCEFTWRTDGTTMSSGQIEEFVQARKRIAEKYLHLRQTRDSQPRFSETARPSLVSMVILTFNQIEYTKECVESIRKHTLEPHEIIFVDNGSTDGTVQWLRELVKGNDHYKLIENKTNLGFAKGCNQGIEAASGEYVMLLNNDTVVTEDWLSGMIETLNSSPKLSIVGPMTNSISGPQKVPEVGYSSIDHLIDYARVFRRKNRHRRIPQKRIVGFCMLFRRQLIEEIGFLDESFGSGNFEDDDLCLRATLAGYQNIIAGDVFIHHYGSRTFIGNRIDYGSSLIGNKKIFAQKWGEKDIAQRFGKKLLIQNALARADEFCRKGEIEKATASLIEAIKHAPDDRNLFFKLVEMFIDVKRYDDALGILKSMPQDDTDIQQLALLGYCEEGLGRNDMAQEYAARALAVAPSMAIALNILGVVAYKQGKRDTAEGFFKKAMESDPSFGESYTNLGSLKWDGGERTEALNLFERGFILSPTVADVATAYHSAVAESGALARAESVFLEATALYPMDRRIAFLLIAILIQQEKHYLAMQKIEYAMIRFGIDDGILAAGLEIRRKIGPQEIGIPDDKKGTLSLCMIVKNEEQHLAKCLMSVKSIVNEIIVVDTGSIDRTKNIALSFGAKVFDFTWTNDFSEARNYSLSKASGNWILVLDADEIVSPLDHSKLNQVIKNKAEKRVAYTLVTRNYTNQAGSRGWTANGGVYVHEEAGRGWVPSPKVRLFVNDKRVKFVNPVHELVEPTLKNLRIKIKTCDVIVHHYGRLNQDKVVAKGEEYYRLGMKKIEEAKDDCTALKELAIQASELCKYDEAVRIWERAIELNPNDAVAYMNIGYAYLMLNQHGKASVFSKKAMELDPDLREATLNYAGCELITGDVKTAIFYLEKMLEKEPDYPPAMGRIAASYLVDGQKEKGLKYFERLRKNGYDCGSILEQQARELQSQGRNDQADLLSATGHQIKGTKESTLSLASDCKMTSKSKYSVSDHFVAPIAS